VSRPPGSATRIRVATDDGVVDVTDDGVVDVTDDGVVDVTIARPAEANEEAVTNGPTAT
jgi:hypothetical protein